MGPSGPFWEEYEMKENDPLIWFCELKRAIHLSDFKVAATAQQELKRLGFDVKFIGRIKRKVDEAQQAMIGGSHDLVNIVELAKRLKVDICWLNTETKAGRIPHLSTSRKYLYSLSAVKDALAKRARQNKPIALLEGQS